jgi:hypothetical protein
MSTFFVSNFDVCILSVDTLVVNIKVCTYKHMYICTYVHYILSRCEAKMLLSFFA